MEKIVDWKSAASGAMMLLTGSATAAASPGWQVSEERSPVDDKLTVSARLYPTQVKAADATRSAVLRLQCTEDTDAMAIFDVNFALKYPTPRIITRVGSAVARGRYLIRGRNDFGWIVDAGNFFNEVKNDVGLFVRFEDEEVDVFFDLENVSEAVSKLKAACP